MYDVRKKCEGSLCYDFSAAEKFLNLPAVRAALGVGDRAWEMCSAKVRASVRSFDSDICRSSFCFSPLVKASTWSLRAVSTLSLPVV